MNQQHKIDKGGYMEEALRAYFISLGYFVVRGIKFKYQGFDVTDVDLWLYMRPSTITRERINVDIKNKKTPQAIERIFWTKGLQQVLGLENCIVATTDSRSAVIEFGHKNDVIVLDGNFFSRLNRYKDNQDRFSEEEFYVLFDRQTNGSVKSEWRKRLELCKSALLSQLDYSGCNFWLREAKYFIHEAIIDNDKSEAACRYMYLIASFFLIGLDYIFKDLSFFDSETRSKNLRDGFQHGALGRVGTEQIVMMSTKIIESYLPNGRNLASALKRNVEDEYNLIQSDILKEFFNKTEIIKNLFIYACKLEELAYARIFIPPHSIDLDIQSILGVVLDFSDIERKKFFDVFKSTDSEFDRYS